MLPGLVPSAAAIIGLFWRLALTLQEIFLERTQTGPRHIYQVLNALWETVKPNMCVRCGVVHWPPLQSQFSCGCVSGPVCGAPPPPPRCTPSSPPPAPCPPGTAVSRVSPALILHPRSPSLHSLAHLEAPPPPRPATSKKRLEAGAGPRHGYTSDSADSLHRAASFERNVALLLLTVLNRDAHGISIYSIFQYE